MTEKNIYIKPTAIVATADIRDVISTSETVEHDDFTKDIFF